MNTFEQVLELVGEADVAVAYCDLQSGQQFLLRSQQIFHAASTMKVCVLAELYHRFEKGELKLNDLVVVTNEFTSIVDGSPYLLEEGDDSEKSLYGLIGKSVSLYELGRLMIVDSSNLATNLLVAKLGADCIDIFMRDLGIEGISVKRGVEDGVAYRLGLNNTVTAHGLMTLLSKLAVHTIVSEKCSEAMIEILLAQQHRNCIPAKLPRDIKFANKTGWNQGLCHDCAIVYPKDRRPYVLVVLTRGLDEMTEGPELIASISECIYGKTAS